MYSTLRGVFLTFAFPKLISVGRTFNTKSRERTTLARPKHENNPSEGSTADDGEATEREPLLGSRPQAAACTDTCNDEEDVKDDDGQKVKKQQTFTFDLTYTRGYVMSHAPLPLPLSILSLFLSLSLSSTSGPTPTPFKALALNPPALPPLRPSFTQYTCLKKQRVFLFFVFSDVRCSNIG